jgi:ankyrin repeat protein
LPPNSIDLAQKVQRSLVVEINHYNMAKPTEEESQEFLLSCRYGELDEVKEFVAKFGSDVVSDIRDDRGNSALHMICGNGHLGG